MTITVVHHAVDITPDGDARCSCGWQAGGRHFGSALCRRLAHAHSARPDASTTTLLSFVEPGWRGRRS